MSLSSVAHTDVIGTSVGIFGIILSIVFFIRSKTEVRLCYAIVKQHAIVLCVGDRFPDKFQMRYDNHVIPALSTAIILLWNYGRKTLSKDDILSSDPLRLQFTNGNEDVEALEVRSTHATREALKVDAAPSGKYIHLDFEILDYMEGFALEVFYAGDQETRIECTGTVKGSPKGARRYTPYVLPGDDFSSRFFLVRWEWGLILGAALASFISLISLVASFGDLSANVAQLILSGLIFLPSTFFLILLLAEHRQQTVPRAIRRLVRAF